MYSLCMKGIDCTYNLKKKNEKTKKLNCHIYITFSFVYVEIMVNNNSTY